MTHPENTPEHPQVEEKEKPPVYRRKSGLWLLLALLLILVIMACSQVQAQEVQRIEASGIQGLLIEDKHLPMIVMQLTIQQAGSAYDPEGKAGLASLTSSMITEGAGSMDATAFQEMLDDYAIQLSAEAGHDDLTITLQTLSEHQDKAMELLALMLREPRFDTADIERVRAAHLTMLKRRQEQPSALVSDAFFNTAFTGHPYSKPHAGTNTTIAAMTREDMLDYMKRSIAKAPMQLSVSGDISQATLEQLLSKHFAGIPLNRTQEIPALPQAALQLASSPVAVRIASPQTAVSIITYGINRQDKDFYAAYVLNHMLGGSGLSSRLSIALRQDRGLTYSVGSSLVNQQAASWLDIHFATQTSRTEEAIAAVKTTLEAIATKGLSKTELQAAKDYLTGSFPLALNSNAGRAGYLAMMQRYGLDIDYLEKRNDYIANITLQQVQDVAKAMLTKPLLIITAGEK